MTTRLDYEVDATLTWLATLAADRDAAAPAVRVALQFPDALLSDALAVEAELKSGAAARGLEAEVRQSHHTHAFSISAPARMRGKKGQGRRRHAPAFRPRNSGRRISQPSLHPSSL